MDMAFPLRLAGRRCQSPTIPPNACTTKTSTSSSSSSSSSSFRPRPPLPTVVVSSAAPTSTCSTPETDKSATSTSNEEQTTTPSAPMSPPSGTGATTCTTSTSSTSETVTSFPPPLSHLSSNLATTSAAFAPGTPPLADGTSGHSRPTLERGGGGGGGSRRSSWRSSSVGSMKSIHEDFELLDDDTDGTDGTDGVDDADAHVSAAGQGGKVTKGRSDAGESSSFPSAAAAGRRFPFLSYRTASNSSLTSLSSCPATLLSSSSSSSSSPRERREEKIHRKNFEARHRQFSGEGRAGRTGSTGSSASPRLIHRRRQSIDFIREESQAAATCGDVAAADNDGDDDGHCQYRHRPRSSSLDDSGDRRVHSEHASTGHRRVTMPSDPMSASQTLIGSYYQEQQIHRHQSPLTTATSGVRLLSTPISIIEEEGDYGSEKNVCGKILDIQSNGAGGLLEELEGRGLLKVQNAGLAGSSLYYSTGNRRLSM